jgi:hypothetical protein
MSDQPTITIQSTFTRSHQLASYEQATASVTITEVFDGTVSPEDVATQASNQFLTIKSQVFNELGLPFEQDEESGLIIELFPGAEVVESKPAAKPTARKVPGRRLAPVPDDEPEEDDKPRRAAPRAPRAAAPKPAASRNRKAAADDEDPYGDWADLAENPDDWEYFPDKESKRSPDFRHKTRAQQGNPRFKVSLWLDNAPSWFENPFE